MKLWIYKVSMCVYVFYICVYIHTCVHVCACMHVCVCTYTCRYMFVCVYVYVYMHTYFLVLSTERDWEQQYPGSVEHIWSPDFGFQMPLSD